MLDVLRSTFGLQDFRPGQQAVIERLLAGQSALAIFPTGAGKSLCYQLPAVMLEGLTLVISPLIALMKDQLDALQKRGVAAARLDSSLGAEQARATYADLRAGRLKLLYVAPERFSNERFLETLRELDIAMLAVDEVHCVSEWGHNFRPDYMKLAALAQDLKVPRVLGLTATATPEVAAGIAEAFRIPSEGIIRSPFHRPNLFLDMRPGSAETRQARLLEALGGGPSIVYVTLQRTAENVAAWLREQGRQALVYHAGLEAAERTRVQDAFMASDDAIVVATIAFGMGIDKADIRNVVHYNLPKSVENYAQEIGRAGRDGLPSRCTLLAAPQDVVALENFTFGDTPTTESLGSLLDEILAAGQEFDVSVYDLASRHDIRNLVVDTIMTYLELDGLIRSTRPFYAEYRIGWIKAEADVMRRFDPARREFLTRVLAYGKRGRKWITLDVHQAAAQMGEPRDRVVRAVNYLEEQGDISLQVAGVRQGYRRLSDTADREAILRGLVERFETRERRDLERLREVQALAHSQTCATLRMLGYFGETLEGPCGHCNVCAGQPPAPPKDLRSSLDEEQRSRITRVGTHEALRHPRQLARFLCGLSSPATTRARLTSHPHYGALSDVPFQQVLEAVSAVGAR